jgi:hypothetical protein
MIRAGDFPPRPIPGLVYFNLILCIYIRITIIYDEKFSNEADSLIVRHRFGNYGNGPGVFCDKRNCN